MTLTRIQVEHVKLRIQRKAQALCEQADDTRDVEQSIVLRALADGLEAALAIIEEEDS